MPLRRSLLQHDRLISLADKSTTTSAAGGGSVVTGVTDVAGVTAGDNENIKDENDEEVGDNESDCGSENDGCSAVDG